VFTLRSLLALSLVLWCAGAGCMMVSYARAATNHTSGAAALMDHAMGGSMSMDAHACCKAKRRASKATRPSESRRSFESAGLNLLALPSTPTQSGVMNCCPLTTGSIVTASRSQSNDHATTLQQSAGRSFLSISSDPLPLAVPLRLPDRAHSYLLDCAFLI
jgi:hypothetical protein